MTLSDVKLYLRIDTDADDTLLETMMQAADNYMIGAVTGYEKNYAESEKYASAADICKMAIIAQMYEDRNSQQKGDFGFVIRSMINQLEYWSEADD